MKAVHFGAGNIGRGFVGLILHKAGYEVVFADVNAELIDALASTPSYVVTEVGDGASVWTVDNYRALNSSTHEADVIAEIASADIVTTAVGPNILRFVAPLIAKAIAQRSADLEPLAVMACENAINATDLLKVEVVKALPDAALADGAIFANTAVDRIVPGQDRDAGLNVTVESFFEWAIESTPFGAVTPVIPDAHFVDDLAPYIERKLFTVNTGHATAAYHGFAAGVSSMSEAFSTPEIAAEVRAVLAETKALLVAKHDFDPEVQQAYIDKNMVRFANPELSDTVDRVGRQPLRKLGRNERFVGPAAELAERGLGSDALVRTMGIALEFDVAEDPQSVELQQLLSDSTADEFVTSVTGLDAAHPLYPAVVEVVRAHQK
ncbi:mannitol-1-phosphate 5-dehydrogenase [Conyzicola nivalis]|uniref:Mannitol-1-phosphate 5-dehydrogenase n=1 Tax=Conyzicola nivalis TaxID=1477021 RepID=A0A916SBN7_9MICO|nr:mannitol-1-phosphate 5-dehydrogenase [Conyzicola nivalis]GGA90264.1 mannitol-1-phosphate 5-dehydrogenase [Conyzicola nivalis]